jgi:uncharacterized membrane protein
MRFKTVDAENGRNVKAWTIAWVVTCALAAFGTRILWDFATIPTIVGVLINLTVGFFWVLAIVKQVNAMDELQPEIFLDAAATTLGVGVVCGLSYELLEDIRLISFQPEIPHLVLLMCLTFMASRILGYRRYR